MEEFLALALRQPLLLMLAIFVSLLLVLGIGRGLGRRWARRFGAEDAKGVGLLDGAIFALLGLLVALSFNGAAGRFDARRQLIVEEANAIGTARLRVDLLPADLQPSMQGAFDHYIKSRADAYTHSTNLAEFRAALRRSAAIQREIWGIAVAGGRRPDASPAVNIQLLPALNTMIDITTTRAMAMRMHTPPVVYLVLWMSAAAAALIAGYDIGQGRQLPWLHVLTFVGVMTVTLYVLVDLEYPRVGLIRLTNFDRVMTGTP